LYVLEKPDLALGGHPIICSSNRSCKSLHFHVKQREQYLIVLLFSPVSEMDKMQKY